MVRVYLDPLVNLISVASIIWVVGRCYGVQTLVSYGMPDASQAVPAEQTINEKTVGAMTILAIVLNLMSNTVKFFDSRYMWSFTLPSYVFLQLILICCEIVIVVLSLTSTYNSAALSFLIDVGYISLLIAFMETTCYILHRMIRTEEYDIMKKSV